MTWLETRRLAFILGARFHFRIQIFIGIFFIESFILLVLLIGSLGQYHTVFENLEVEHIVVMSLYTLIVNVNILQILFFVAEINVGTN